MTKLPDAIQHLSPADLVPYEKNPRKHSQLQVAKLAESITRYGFNSPILVDSERGVVAGHGRLLAAKKLGLEHVPVVVLDHLTDEQRRAYIIADNQLGEMSSWDDTLLLDELQRLHEVDEHDMAGLGFTTDQLDDLLREEPEKEKPAPAGLDQGEVRVQLGELWTLGVHQLMIGDATNPDDVARLLAGRRPNLMVTDPPYGVSYDPSWRNKVLGRTVRSEGEVANDDRADWTEAYDLFPGDVAYVWHGGLHAAEVAASLEESGFSMRAQIIWNKGRFVVGRGNYHWQHEPCWYAVRNKADWQGSRRQSTVWEFPNNNNNTGAGKEKVWGHGTQKPVEAMRRPILHASPGGGLVYDPFMGTGTTLIAAEQEGRIALGLELDPVYADIVLRRYQETTGAEPVREDGTSYSDLMA